LEKKTQIYKVLDVATSWKYWRWSMAYFNMPKFFGTSLPPELAHKILLEGLDKHKKEVEKYLPQIKSKAYFNTFSRIYNRALVTALFTVVPYMTHQYYTEQMKLAAKDALEALKPLLETTQEMADIDQVMQQEIGALDKYIQGYIEKNGVAPSEAHMDAVKAVLHAQFSKN
jgi:hypothetical protein